MASSVTAPLERQFGQVPGLNQMTSTSSDGSSVITLQFVARPEHRRRRAGGAGGDQRGRRRTCRSDLPNPPIYSKTNPADAPILTLGADVRDAAAVEGRGPRRHAAGAEDLAAARRRPGEHQRRPEAGGAHPGQSDGAVVARPEPRRRAHRASRRPTSTRPRAASTARGRPTRSAPTTSCSRASSTAS